jgi:hypothetical protein
VFDTLELGWLWDAVGMLPRNDRWQTQARSALRDALMGALADLADDALYVGGAAEWAAANERVVSRAMAMFAEIRRTDTYDLTTLSVLAPTQPGADHPTSRHPSCTGWVLRPGASDANGVTGRVRALSSASIRFVFATGFFHVGGARTAVQLGSGTGSVAHSCCGSKTPTRLATGVTEGIMTLDWIGIVRCSAFEGPYSKATRGSRRRRSVRSRPRHCDLTSEQIKSAKTTGASDDATPRPEDWPRAWSALRWCS